MKITSSSSSQLQPPTLPSQPAPAQPAPALPGSPETLEVQVESLLKDIEKVLPQDPVKILNLVTEILSILYAMNKPYLIERLIKTLLELKSPLRDYFFSKTPDRKVVTDDLGSMKQPASEGNTPVQILGERSHDLAGCNYFYDLLKDNGLKNVKHVVLEIPKGEMGNKEGFQNVLQNLSSLSSNGHCRLVEKLFLRQGLDTQDLTTLKSLGLDGDTLNDDLDALEGYLRKEQDGHMPETEVKGQSAWFVIIKKLIMRGIRVYCGDSIAGRGYEQSGPSRILLGNSTMVNEALVAVKNCRGTTDKVLVLSGAAHISTDTKHDSCLDFINGISKMLSSTSGCKVELRLIQDLDSQELIFPNSKVGFEEESVAVAVEKSAVIRILGSKPTSELLVDMITVGKERALGQSVRQEGRNALGARVYHGTGRAEKKRHSGGLFEPKDFSSAAAASPAPVSTVPGGLKRKRAFDGKGSPRNLGRNM